MAPLRNPNGTFANGHKPHPRCFGKGSKMPESAKIKLSKYMSTLRGKTSRNWKGGKTPFRQRIRGHKRYKEWRKSIFVRDNYTCQECGSRGVRVNAHHIKKLADYPECAFDLLNGVTLCEPCHLKTENFGARIPLSL
jgi:hypothetical protein